MKIPFPKILITSLLFAATCIQSVDANPRLRDLAGGGPVAFFARSTTRPYGMGWVDVSVNASHGAKLCHVWVNGVYVGQHWTDSDGHWNYRLYERQAPIYYGRGAVNHFRFQRPNGSVNNVTKVNNPDLLHHAPERANI
jgi:hypothetical protein